MSAIHLVCPACGETYIAGMVGSAPWPPHECPLKARVELLETELKEAREALAPFAEVWGLMVEFDAMFTPLPNQHHYRRAWLVLDKDRARAVIEKQETR